MVVILIINSWDLDSRAVLDEIQSPDVEEADVSFRMRLLHHVLFSDKIPGKILKIVVYIVGISLKETNEVWL